MSPDGGFSSIDALVGLTVLAATLALALGTAQTGQRLAARAKAEQAAAIAARAAMTAPDRPTTDPIWSRARRPFAAAGPVSLCETTLARRAGRGREALKILSICSPNVVSR